jgi:uncharacterized membrane protein YdbT with pleckstrin-like domain
MPEDTIHTTHSRNPLAMFAPQPVGVAFEGEERGEKVILLLRPHLVTLVPAAGITIFLVLAPTFVPVFLRLLDIDLSQSLNFLQTMTILIIWYLFVFGYAFYKFVFWYFNVYLLTNERIVDFDFRGILHREVSYANLNQIQDVSPKTIGFFGTFFHFGNVFVQTAAVKPEFEFHHVPRPNEVAREILEQVRLEEKEAPGAVE